MYYVTLFGVSDTHWWLQGIMQKYSSLILVHMPISLWAVGPLVVGCCNVIQYMNSPPPYLEKEDISYLRKVFIGNLSYSFPGKCNQPCLTKDQR